MSDEEVDELLKAVDTSSGEINYTGEGLLGYNSTIKALANTGAELVRMILAN